MSETLPMVDGKADLRAAIEQAQGRVFIYCNCPTPTESIQSDWASKITAEYRQSGKEFLLGKNGDGAVFGPHAHFLIPAAPRLEVVAWVRKFLKPLVAETNLFTELREEAEAKAAARSELLSGNVFFHTGDLGDIIAALPTIRALGGGYLILGNRHGRGGRELMTQGRFDVIAPLLRAQSYMTGVELLDDAPAKGEIPVTHDFTLFREHAPPLARIGNRLLHGGAGYNLATWQASYFGVQDVDLSPWITVPPGDDGIRNEARGKAIFARTERYHNPKFDWKGRVQSDSPALFVGMEDEFRAFGAEFCNQVGVEVRYRQCANLLEVAQLIDGSRFFVGNQSCPCWIAMAMGHNLIQETDQWNLNSVVERTNAEYRQ